MYTHFFSLSISLLPNSKHTPPITARKERKSLCERKSLLTVVIKKGIIGNKSIKTLDIIDLCLIFFNRVTETRQHGEKK